MTKLLFKGLILVLSVCSTKAMAQSDVGPTSSTQSAFPQYMPNLLPPSPDAFSFTRYGNLPIGLNTGTVQFNVAVYTITAGSLSHSIGLNYSSNGVKVDEMATRVGINWSLSAGGAITRIVQDLPDGGAGVQPTFLNVPIVLDTSDERVWDFYDYVRQAQNASPPDYAPDEYSFNVGGYTGKFIKRENGDFQVYNANGVKIAQTGAGFVLTLPNGDRYYFEVYEFAENYTLPYSEFLETSPSNVPNAWYLTKILSTTRDSILFNYAPVTTSGDSAVTFFNGISQNFSWGTSDWYYVNTTPYSLGTRPLLLEGYAGYACWDPSPPGVVTAVQKSENYALAIQSIEFPNGSVQFKYSSREDIDGEKKLDSIIVRRSSDNSVVSKWAMSYTYSYASPGNFDTYLSTSYNFTNQAPELRKRMFLTTVDQLSKSTNDTTRWRHQFFYKDINALPPRLSFAQDRYGYFNGKVNTLFFPNDTYFDRFIGNNRFGGDRSFSAYFAQKGVLEKVIYPTGGYTKFEYEPHQLQEDYAFKFFRDSVFVSIDTSTYAEQEFYSDTISSDFNMILRGSCDWASQAIITNNGTGDIELEDQYYLTLEIIDISDNSCAVAPYCTTVIYPGQNFTDPKYGWFLAGGTYKIKVTASKPSLRGRITLEKFRQEADRSDSSGIAGIRVKSVTDYSQDGVVAGKRRFIYGDWEDSTSSSGVGVTLSANNSNELSMTRMVGTEIAPFHTTNPDAPSVWCGYNTIHSNSVITNFRTENNTVTYKKVIELPVGGENDLQNNGGTEYEFNYESKKYPIPIKFIWGSYVWDPWPYVPPGAPYMNNDFITGLPKSVRQFTYSSIHGTRNVLREQMMYYSLDTPHLTIDTFTVAKVVRKNADAVPAWPYFSNYDVYRFWRYFGFLRQDSIVTRDYTGSGTIAATQVFYDYHPQNFLPRDIRVLNSQGGWQKITRKYTPDVLFGQPDYTILQNMRNANMINGILEERVYNGNTEQIKKRLSYSQTLGLYLPDSAFSQPQMGTEYLEAAYQLYDSSGNLLQMTSRDGVVNSFVWGYSKTYPVARIVGRSYSDAISSSGVNMSLINQPTSEQALATELNKFRSLSNALVTTYIYEPLVGMKRETDPNGRTIYYEYDYFNRLSAVRDNDRNIIQRICYNLKGQPSLCGYGTQPAWQVISTACELNGSGANTGNIVTTEKDMNPASASYLQTRSSTVANAAACPSCSTETCVGEAKKCINGVCETGQKICTSSVRISQTVWLVTYHYKWSDNSESQNYQVYGPNCLGPID